MSQSRLTQGYDEHARPRLEFGRYRSERCRPFKPVQLHRSGQVSLQVPRVSRGPTRYNDSVHGLNLAVPEQAKELIKPWSDREDATQFADSGVDDQVRTNHDEPGGDITPPCLQMIIHVPFSQNVRIKSVILKLGKAPSFISPCALRPSPRSDC